jgi:hypothetical protein
MRLSAMAAAVVQSSTALLAQAWHGHGPDAAVFADEVDDGRASIALLDVFDCQTHYFAATQDRSRRACEERAIAFAFEGAGVRKREELFGLPNI